LRRKVFELLVARHNRPADLLDEMTHERRAVGADRELGGKPTAIRDYLSQHVKIKNADAPDDLEPAQHDIAADRRSSFGNARIGFRGAVEDGDASRIHASSAGKA
jgi:hypothetical protein